MDRSRPHTYTELHPLFTQPEHGKRIQWESITGLPNKGLVTFEEKAPGMTVMELTLSYSVPKPIAKVSGCLHRGRLDHEQLFGGSKKPLPCLSCRIDHYGHWKRSCVVCDLNEFSTKHPSMHNTQHTGGRERALRAEIH